MKEFDDEAIVKTWMIICYKMNDCNETKKWLIDFILSYLNLLL